MNKYWWAHFILPTLQLFQLVLLQPASSVQFIAREYIKGGGYIYNLPPFYPPYRYNAIIVILFSFFIF